MEDWAEVHRLFHREGLAKAAIARRLGIGRNTVDRLLARPSRRAIVRAPQGSQLDPFAERIQRCSAADPTVRATVIRERLQADGYRGGITILKDHLARVRPDFLAARAYQRTSYRPGEIGQVDWWHTGAQVPVGRGRTREAFGLVDDAAVQSAAHAISSPCPGRSGDLRPALRGLSRAPGRRAREARLRQRRLGRRHGQRLAGPAPRRGRRAARGAPRPSRSSCARPGRPRRATSSGRSAMPRRASCRCARSPRSMTSRASTTPGRPRSPSAVTSGASARRSPTAAPPSGPSSRALPDPRPDTDLQLEARAGKDAFVRVLDVDYSVPPAFVGRRVSACGSPDTVRLFAEGSEIAVHRRSFVPADVVLAPAHGRAIRLAREARDRLADGDAGAAGRSTSEPYDALWEVPA